MSNVDFETRNEPTKKEMKEIENEFKDILNETFDEPEVKRINPDDILTEEDLVMIEKMVKVLNRKKRNTSNEDMVCKSVKELDFNSFSFEG